MAVNKEMKKIVLLREEQSLNVKYTLQQNAWN